MKKKSFWLEPAQIILIERLTKQRKKKDPKFTESAFIREILNKLV